MIDFYTNGDELEKFYELHIEEAFMRIVVLNWALNAEIEIYMSSDRKCAKCGKAIVYCFS